MTTNARDLTKHLADLLRREHGAMADFLVALADFDKRRLWVDLGHASLFSFLRRELGLSAGAAQYRKTAAELVQRYPEVEVALRTGQLCLSSVIELGKVLTPENLAEVLPRFFGLSSRDASLLAASIRPVEDPPMRAMVTPLRASAPAPAPAVEKAVSSPSQEQAPPLLFRAPEVPVTASTPDEPAPASPARAVPVLPATPMSLDPIDFERVRLHVTVPRRLLEKLEAARAALSHARPGASADEILEAGLDLLLAQHAKRKGLVEKPRKASPPAKPDHLPAHVKRAVWIRDGGRCQFPLASGGVCGSTLRVEFDHIQPRAKGGPSTVDNVRLACRQHNIRAARLAFGDAWMDRFTHGSGECALREAPAPTPPR